MPKYSQHSSDEKSRAEQLKLDGANQKMPNSNEKVNECIKAIVDYYNADIYLYSGEIADRGFGKLVKCVSKGIERPNCFLILVTGGGLANSAYQIARLLQKTYDSLIVFTPSFCKSAGTLIALGAHVLVMDQFSELGPLDVQLVRTDEITGRRSGLVTKSAFESLSDQSFELFENFMLRLIVQSRGNVSFKTAAEVSATITSDLMSEIYKQISPELVGNDYRDLTVAVEYGNRLASYSNNTSSGTVMRLVHEYPSHDFIIDEEEASSLFDNIERPINEIYDLIGLIGEPIYQEADPVLVRRIRPNAVPPANNGDDNQSGSSADEEDNVQNDQTEHHESNVSVDESGGNDRRSDQDESPEKAAD